jgi:hypothetical protein
MLTDEREVASRSTNWQAAKTAADAEVAQMVAKLRKAHPHVQISAVMSHGQAPGFVLKASDQDAKAIADEDDVSGPELAPCRRRRAAGCPVAHWRQVQSAADFCMLCSRAKWGTEVMLQKFQAEVKQTPAVTVLHRLNCPNCNGTDVPARIVRGRNVSEATLELIAIYMSNDVRREVTACRCTKAPPKPPGGFWSRLRSA